MVDGLCFDVEHDALWLDAWGPRPASAPGRAAIVRAQVDAAPRLAPLFGHRYLVLDPCAAGNPVLSIVQADIIVYGDDLRSYLLAELGALIGGAVPPPAPPASPRRQERGLWDDLL